MLRRTQSTLLVLLAASCSGPPVAITLDQAAVRTVDHATLFAKYNASRTDGPPRQVLELRISSQTELLKHFKDHGKQLQVRCSVNGTTNKEPYNDSAFGPFPEDGSSNDRHHYAIYAFVDLVAHAAEYQNGKPASTLNLKSDPFDSLSCQLVGVEKAPVRFLRSNEIVLSASSFQALLGQAAEQ